MWRLALTRRSEQSLNDRSETHHCGPGPLRIRPIQQRKDTRLCRRRFLRQCENLLFRYRSHIHLVRMKDTLVPRRKWSNALVEDLARVSPGLLPRSLEAPTDATRAHHAV